MTIPVHAKGKQRNSIMNRTLEEIQVDSVPNPKTNGISMESKFNYFLILCDRYSRIFKTIGIRDKTSEACVNGIEQLIYPTFSKNLMKITHIRLD